MIKSLNSIVSLIGYLSLASTASASLSAPTTPTTSGSSYIIRAFEGTALQLAADVFRVPISKNSSGGDFTFLATSGGVSESRVTPHYHLNAYETFYCQKGALNIWANGESRRLSAGDFAAVPHHTNHSYQLLEPDTLLVGVIQPGGFEDFFFNVSTPYSSNISTPWPASQPLDFPIAAFGAASADSKFDVYVEANAPLPSNQTNGTSSNSTPWHTGNNSLPTDSITPYFIANNWGPKFLHPSGSVLAPLINNETTSSNWTLSTITFQKESLKDRSFTFNTSQAIYVLEGSLVVEVGSNQTETLQQSDLIYLTPNEEFKVYGERNWAKALLIGAGIEGVSAELLAESQSWVYAVGPAYKIE